MLKHCHWLSECRVEYIVISNMQKKTRILSALTEAGASLKAFVLPRKYRINRPYIVSNALACHADRSRCQKRVSQKRTLSSLMIWITTDLYGLPGINEGIHCVLYIFSCWCFSFDLGALITRRPDKDATETNLHSSLGPRHLEHRDLSGIWSASRALLNRKYYLGSRNPQLLRTVLSYVSIIVGATRTSAECPLMWAAVAVY